MARRVESLRLPSLTCTNVICASYSQASDIANSTARSEAGEKSVAHTTLWNPAEASVVTCGPTVSTGHGDSRITSSATEPSTTLSHPARLVVPTTTRSAA